MVRLTPALSITSEIHDDQIDAVITSLETFGKEKRVFPFGGLIMIIAFAVVFVIGVAIGVTLCLF